MSDSKEHIISVASRLFLQKNFKEVTMKEIVDKTGLSKGAFYHYFKSKEELFGEVIDHFFTVVNPKFDGYSKESLYGFFHDYVINSNPFNYLVEYEGDENDPEFRINFYSLFFDALKLIPGFRTVIEENLEKEIGAWVTVIKNAKEKGEIKSTLSDRQIAKIFIYSGDGVAMHLILDEKFANIKTDLLSVWQSFYESLKA